MSERVPWVVGVTGASGVAYAAAVLRGLVAEGHPVDLVISQAGRLTVKDETGVAVSDRSWRHDLAAWAGVTGGDLRYWRAADFAAGPASGSYPTRGMVVVPASAASVAGIALGISKDLIQRAADVTLKERRPLVVVPRETPLSRPMLLRMLDLVDAGAVVLPASPGFYGGPTTVADLVDFVAGKVLGVLGVHYKPGPRWPPEQR